MKRKVISRTKWFFRCILAQDDRKNLSPTGLELDNPASAGAFVMKLYVMGIDFGSTTAKTVILDLKGNIVSSCISSMGAVSDHGVKASVEGALTQAGLTQDDMGRTVSTGYGR